MEFNKSDVVGDAGGSTGSEMSLEEFLNNLSENFEQVESILEKADKTGLALGNTGGGNSQAGGSQRGNGQKVQDVINRNRGGGSSNESTSNSANAQPSPSSSSPNISEIVYKILQRFDDDTQMPDFFCSGLFDLNEQPFMVNRTFIKVTRHLIHTDENRPLHGNKLRFDHV